MSKPEENTTAETPNTTVKKRARFWNILKRTFVILAVLLLVLLSILHFPPFQQWAAKKATVFLSEKLETTVSLDKLKFGILGGVDLNKFYVEDLNGDTMIVAQNLNIDLGLGLWSLIGNRLYIEEIGLTDAALFLRRDIGQVDNNLGQILNKLIAKEEIPKEESGVFYLDLESINLDNFHFVQIDSVVGQTLDIYTDDGQILLDDIDLEKKTVKVKSIKIENPNVKIFDYEENPLKEVIEEISNVINEQLPFEPDTNVFLATAEIVDIKNGKFLLNNYRLEPEKLTPTGVLNYNYLDVSNIDLKINNFSYSEWEFKGELEHGSLTEINGFELEKLAAKDVTVNCTETILNGMELITPNSTLGDTLIFKYKEYPDWRNFVERVRIDARIKNSSLAFKDIITFAPQLQENIFFSNNQERIFEINGKLKGRINRLNGRDLDIRLADKLLFEGSFGSRDLQLSDEAIMNLEVKRLKTDMLTLRQLIPGFNPPQNFDKLTRLDFTGRFDGFFVDWVTKGSIKTNLGNAYTDINLNVVNGRANAEYSGDLSLFDFDLGEWSGSSDLGKITFNAKVREGRGLELQNANAKLIATIDSLQFKNYDYRNVIINGQLNQKFFNGDLNIKDPNMDLDFGGTIDFTNETPSFDFSAVVKKLALKPLNLSNQDFAFGGVVDIHLLDNDLSDIRGTASLKDLQVIHNQEDVYNIDSVILNSSIDENGTKSFEVLSDILETKFKGNFDIEEVPLTFLQFFERNYPEFADRLNIHPKEIQLDSSKFDFSINIFDPKNLNDLIDPKLRGLQNLNVFGHYDGFIDSVFMDLEIDSFEYDNLKFVDVVSIGKVKGSESDMQLGIGQFMVNGKSIFERFIGVGYVDKDEIEFGLYVINMSELVDDLNLEGVFSLEPNNNYRVNFKNSDLAILNEKWNIIESNFIQFGNGKVATQNFVMTNGNQEIVLNTIGEKGLELLLENVKLGTLNEYWIYEPLDFQGSVDLRASAENIFQLENLDATLQIDTLLINGDDWGYLRLDAATAKLENAIESNFTLTKKDEFQVIGEGHYNPPTFIPTKGKPFPKNYFDLEVGLTTFPLNFLEYLLEGSISNTIGDITGGVRFFGTPEKIDIEGEAEGKGIATSLDFLKTRYFVDQGTVKIDSKKFDGTGIKVRDELGNYATVTGGLVHDNLKNMGLDVSIQTDGSQFLAMNTTKKDNPVLYGTGLGRGRIKFTGLFAQTNAEITATTAAGTKIAIPISTDESAAEHSFIVFKDDFANENEHEDVPEINGLNLNMNLQMTQDAQVELIFDEKWGDVIRGNGDGNLQVFMGRDGSLEMRGTYVVNEGDYLFTLGLVNKPFNVEKGGLIIWDGDPFNAEIRINAIYDGVSANLYNFIQEFISTASQDVLDAARNSTPIKLGMELTGELFKPDINFKIDFPNLPPELKSYVDSKMRIIQQDQNELNRQVFGLLVSGQFLPTGGGLPYADIPINTISEMLANQLSIYVTELVSQWLSEDGFISGIDIDLNLNRYSAQDINNLGEYNQTGNEFQGKLKLLFKDDRLIFHAGGNFDWGNTASLSTVPTNSSQFGQEFMLEYVLTEDRKFRVRLYQRTEPDLNGRKLKIGGGLSFRKEFDTLKELFDRKK